MRKSLIILFCFFSVFVNADDYYHLVGTDSKYHNKWYVNLDPDYLSLSSSYYDFWYKVSSPKNKTLYSARVRIDLGERQFCTSDYTDYVNSSKSFSIICIGALGSRPAGAWSSVMPDTMMSLLKKYLDSVYVANNSSSNTN